MRTILDENPILEAAGLVFTGIADDVTWRDGRFRSNGPFAGHGKPAAAATAKSGVADFSHDVSVNRLVSAGAAVLLEGFAVGGFASWKKNHKLDLTGITLRRNFK